MNTPINPAYLAQTRHSCKAFAAHTLAPHELSAIETLLRYAPSSLNTQPWHFVLATTAAGKARLAQAMPAPAYAYNASKVEAASAVVLLCTKTDYTDADMAAVLAQEQADGRFATAQDAAKRKAACDFFLHLHRERGDVPAWLTHQVYLALGSVLLGVAAMGLDACPIEGFDTQAMDAALALSARGLRSTVVLAIGRRSTADFNAALPKSRLPAQHTITYL